MRLWPAAMERIWYRTRTGHDPVPPPEPFNATVCQVCGSPGSTICPWHKPFSHLEAPVGDVTRPQQDPKPGLVAITALVVADLEERRAQGIAKYGTELKSHNGRDPLVDAYQESLDQTMYLRQAIEERRGPLFAGKDPAQLELDFDYSAKYDAAPGCMSPGQSLGGRVEEPRRTAPDPEKVQNLLDLKRTIEENPDSLKFVDWKKCDDIPADLASDALIGMDYVMGSGPTESIAQEAHRLVIGDRGAMYGHPIEDFGRSAGMINALLGAKLNAPLVEEDIAKLMICVKLSREQNRPKRDNVVDLAGYAITLEMVKEERARRESEKA